MTPLACRVRRTIRRRELLASEDRVAVAVSGGPDSVALARVLRELERPRGWRLVGLIHVNHGLRGAESDADEVFCRDLATRLDLPIVVLAADVARRQREQRESVEVAARVERYAAFERAARELDATRVATGHTMDDQAETVLLRLFRGAGSRGLSAIRPRRGPYVRPLIDVSRAQVSADLVARGEAPRSDSSNSDLTIVRNRLRHTVLPVIARDWPGAVAALARFAELATDDERFLTDTAREVSSAVAIPSSDGVQQIDARGLNQLPAALARRVVRQAVESAGGRASFRDLETVRAFARMARPDAHLDLSGLAVVRQGPLLRFAEPGAVAGCRPFEYGLPVPGSVTVAETGTTIVASLGRGREPRPGRDEPAWAAVLSAADVALPLTVRNRRPGDRLRPFGAAGTRKLQDLLVDRKVPRADRDRVPLVIDRRGRILWVVGHAIAEDGRVTSPQSGVVILEIKKGNL